MKRLSKINLSPINHCKPLFFLSFLIFFMLQGCFDTTTKPIPTNPTTHVTITPTLATGNHFYVSSTGSKSSVCSLTSPCLNYKDAEALATAGDVIHLSGNFGEIHVTKSGNENAPIMIQGHKAILNGLNIEANYVQIYNIEVTQAFSHGILVQSKHVLIQDSIVHDSVTENGINGQCALTGDDASWGSGLKIRVGAEDVILRNNTVFNNCGEGIAITRGANILVENNTVKSNYSVGIYIDNSYNVVVNKNHIICDDTYLRNRNRMSGIVLTAEIYDGWGMQLHDNSVFNNTINGCYDSIAVWEPDDESPVADLIIDKNTSINSVRYSIDINSISENITVSNNLLDKPVHFDEEEGLILLNNITQTPSP